MKYRPLLTAGREADTAARIDAFRTSFTDGLLVLSARLFEAGPEMQQRALNAARAFDAFTPEDDPYGEHDFGFFTLDGLDFFWKIDACRDSDCLESCDPLDPGAFRLLHLMFAED